MHRNQTGGKAIVLNNARDDPALNSSNFLYGYNQNADFSLEHRHAADSDILKMQSPIV